MPWGRERQSPFKLAEAGADGARFTSPKELVQIAPTCRLESYMKSNAVKSYALDLDWSAQTMLPIEFKGRELHLEKGLLMQDKNKADTEIGRQGDSSTLSAITCFAQQLNISLRISATFHQRNNMVKL